MSQAHGKKQVQMLVVDDEPSICDIVAAYMERKNYRVYRAGSGEEAVRMLGEITVDCVLSDIKMPGMSGVDLLKWVKENHPHMPVIITTGFPTLDTAIEALKLGAYDYLTKPFHLEEIAQKVDRALESRRIIEENILLSRLVTIHEVSKVLSSTHQIKQLQEKFVEFAVRLSRADMAALHQVKSDGKETMSLVMHPKEMPAEFWSHPFFIGAQHWVREHKDPLCVQIGTSALPESVPPPPPGVGSIVIYPMTGSKRLIGYVMLVRGPDGEPFSDVDNEILNVLVSQGSISIENTRLYDSLREGYLRTISSFAKAVEAKDSYTHNHSATVSEYTVALARSLGIKHGDLERIKYAGLLHDIGKIGVPEEILNKPGKLDPHERLEIEKHPAAGAEILAEVPFLKILVPMVRYHHEWYNGGGYPEHKAGEDIPWGARILSVADAFEAMTSDRPYRTAMDWGKALSILKGAAGTQFDPLVVAAFEELVSSGQLKKKEKTE